MSSYREQEDWILRRRLEWIAEDLMDASRTARSRASEMHEKSKKADEDGEDEKKAMFARAMASADAYSQVYKKIAHAARVTSQMGDEHSAREMFRKLIR